MAAQTIQAFQAAGAPVAVGLVVDSSQSMEKKRSAVAAATAAFARLSDPRDEVFMVHFNEKVRFSFPDTKLLATSPAQLAGALLDLPAEGPDSPLRRHRQRAGAYSRQRHRAQSSSG